MYLSPNCMHSPKIMLALLGICASALCFQTKNIPTFRKLVLFAESEGASFQQIIVPQRFKEASSPLHSRPYPSKLHSIYVVPILSENQASKCLDIATKYAEETECWKSKDSERHVSYSTADFPIDDCHDLESYLNDIEFEKNTFNLIGELFDIQPKDLSFLDLFCAHYRGSNEGDSIMDRLALHRDGSLISFTIVLSSPDEYDGGGTEFDALKDASGQNYEEFEDVLQAGVIKVKIPGQAVLHCGKIQHGAHTVVSGKRTTLTGFVEVDPRCVRAGVIGEACKQWGRMDNAKNLSERQAKYVGHVDEGKFISNGWILSSSKYISNKGKKRSHVIGYAPAFSSVQRRGKFENMREKNLETEDILLRDILLPSEDRMDPREMFDLSSFGDITIL